MSVFRNLLMAQSDGGEDYIQDGLAFHLDCRDAKPSADGNNWQWVDRIGKIPFDMTAVLQQADKGLVFDGVKSYGENLEWDVDERDWTIEVCYVTNGQSIYYILDVPYSYKERRYYAVDSEGLFVGGVDTGGGYNIKKENTNIVSVNRQQCIQNKRNISHIDALGYNLGEKNVIGTRSNGTLKLNGIIYSIRKYNRLLTEEEMLHNQQVDIDTFFGGVTPQ